MIIQTDLFFTQEGVELTILKRIRKPTARERLFGAFLVAERESRYSRKTYTIYITRGGKHKSPPGENVPISIITQNKIDIANLHDANN